MSENKSYDPVMLELYIPYEYKYIGKQNDLYFCFRTKKWLLPSSHPNFEQLKTMFEKVYLCDDYELKDTYKIHGAKYEPDNKRWYTYRINEKLSEYFLE